MNIHSDLLHAKIYFNCLMLLLVTECSVKSNLGFGQWEMNLFIYELFEYPRKAHLYQSAWHIKMFTIS